MRSTFLNNPFTGDVLLYFLKNLLNDIKNQIFVPFQYVSKFEYAD